MTEEEAKTKWCPFARPNGGNGANRLGTRASDKDPRCIGSECVAWRWNSNGSTLFVGRPHQHGDVTEEVLLRLRAVEVGRYRSGEGPRPGLFRDYSEWNVPSQGGCGLAGS